MVNLCANFYQSDKSFTVGDNSVILVQMITQKVLGGSCLKKNGNYGSMNKRFLKVVIMASGGALLGALLGYIGQCAGST